MENDIIWVEVEGKKYWSSRREQEAIKDFFNKRFNYIMEHYKPIHQIIKEIREDKKRDLKWCYIKIGNTIMTAMIDKKTNKVYKCDGYNITNIEWKRYTFIKYLTSMEL